MLYSDVSQVISATNVIGKANFSPGGDRVQTRVGEDERLTYYQPSMQSLLFKTVVFERLIVLSVTFMTNKSDVFVLVSSSNRDFPADKKMFILFLFMI